MKKSEEKKSSRPLGQRLYSLLAAKVQRAERAKTSKPVAGSGDAASLSPLFEDLPALDTDVSYFRSYY